MHAACIPPAARLTLLRSSAIVGRGTIIGGLVDGTALVNNIIVGIIQCARARADSLSHHLSEHVNPPSAERTSWKVPRVLTNL